MSTIKTINVIHPSGVTNNIVTDASGNVAVGGALTVAGVAAVAVAPGTSGNLLTSNGTAWTSAAPAAPAAPDTQTFDTSGTWTKPAGYSASSLVHVQVWGGGASGARSGTSGQNASGGAGGSYSSAWVALSLLGATETITIGAGGASRTGSNQAGATGGSSSVGSVLAAAGGIAPATATANATLTAPVSVSGYISEIQGGQGTSGNSAGTYYPGAGGAGVNLDDVAGTAGGSRFGGAGGAGSLTTATAGTAPGGGGGGARSTSGAGAAGRVVITVYPA
jgi:hypothetical protein